MRKFGPYSILYMYIFYLEFFELGKASSYLNQINSIWKRIKQFWGDTVAAGRPTVSFFLLYPRCTMSHSALLLCHVAPRGPVAAYPPRAPPRSPCYKSHALLPRSIFFGRRQSSTAARFFPLTVKSGPPPLSFFLKIFGHRSWVTSPRLLHAESRHHCRPERRLTVSSTTASSVTVTGHLRWAPAPLDLQNGTGVGCSCSQSRRCGALSPVQPPRPGRRIRCCHGWAWPCSREEASPGAGPGHGLSGPRGPVVAGLQARNRPIVCMRFPFYFWFPLNPRNELKFPKSIEQNLKFSN
jgi:hypothetical protein